jgi:glutaredoxin 2
MFSGPPMHKPAPDDLALYYYDGCPFCDRVQRVVRDLGLPVDLRHVLRERRHMDDLVAARGRRTVPVLRIRKEDGTEEWMPESADIIAYLQDRSRSRA